MVFYSLSRIGHSNTTHRSEISLIALWELICKKCQVTLWQRILPPRHLSMLEMLSIKTSIYWGFSNPVVRYGKNTAKNYRYKKMDKRRDKKFDIYNHANNPSLRECQVFTCLNEKVPSFLLLKPKEENPISIFAQILNGTFTHRSHCPVETT